MTRRFDSSRPRRRRLTRCAGDVEEARAIHAENRATDEAMARYGSGLIRSSQVMTHCNAGALATAGIGSALGVIRMAVERDTNCTSSCRRRGPITRRAAHRVGTTRGWRPAHAHHRQHGGTFYEDGKRRPVVVGADRVAANGDTANKIGTYQIAVLARDMRSVLRCRAGFDLRSNDPSASRFRSEERAARKSRICASADRPGRRRGESSVRPFTPARLDFRDHLRRGRRARRPMRSRCGVWP